MRHRFLQRYDWVSGFAKCENTTVQDQAVWRAWGYTTAELHCFISEVGGSAATLLWLIFCTHSSMEERQVEGKCRSWSGRFGSFFCRWEEHKVKDKSMCVCACVYVMGWKGLIVLWWDIHAIDIRRGSNYLKKKLTFEIEEKIGLLFQICAS